MADNEHKGEDKQGRSIKEGALQPEATPTGPPSKSSAGGATQSAKSDSSGTGSGGDGGAGGSSDQGGE